jgi:hypothetical protein
VLLTKSRESRDAGVLVIGGEIWVESVRVAENAIGVVNSDSWTTHNLHTRVGSVDAFDDTIAKVSKQL